MKRTLNRLFLFFLAAGLALGLLGLVGVGAAYLVLAPQLPSVESLRDVEYQVPLRVYTREGDLIAEFGEKKRTPLSYDELPPDLVNAFIAAEDERFFEHPGVDYQGLLRAVWYLVRTGEKGPGGSTITMQVARNFFLSREKTYLRKANEILLALKIDRELSKPQIMELYLNKIYLGHRAYGVGAAAQVYYGQPIAALDLAQMAMIAGLPKAPSRDNPVTNPERAKERRAYVLRRMREQGFIDQPTYEQALGAPVTARTYEERPEVEAPYVAEMARAEVVARFGEERAYSAGYKVFTTVEAARQRAAVAALRQGLLDYDRRHGYRGPIETLELAALEDEQARLGRLRKHAVVGGLMPALVLAVDEQGAELLLRSAERVRLPFAAMNWAKPFVNREVVGAAPKTPAEVLSSGDVVRLQAVGSGWVLAQVPQPEGALVGLEPQSGAIRSLVGGFDFFDSKFNRATQARRQPGSSFKPFIYSAALAAGMTPATVINDAPVVFDDPALEDTWRPKNYSGRFYGPTRLREALVRSRNLVSIRVLREIGIAYAIDYLQRFGFPGGSLPRDLSLSLGSASLTPLELARGYAVFANGGHQVQPYLVEEIYDDGGKRVYRAPLVRLCEGCEEEPAALVVPVSAEGGEALVPRERRDAPRVLDARNVYLMNDMLRDVIRRGTGRRALSLGRRDLAGKTGTTNAQQDVWFTGYNSALVGVVWMGFDQLQPLGRGETGSTAALPVWVSYMGQALKGVPEADPARPAGLVSVRIDPESGRAARAENPGAVFELFREDRVPELEPPGAGAPGSGSAGGERPLF
ncbi:penicillin-binding protein 1A [Alkalilimnicola sp. S0819]|uniref:penicillin-binding protein 1A n=1 Tax=Alkalilimnicola sp. S0819 TaxID=2613922 RepID=UPI001261F93B|nr:penicillin-binding protein 1A [Alkalilimnicola sp. S0819]KAB7624412.1 penicillin-binding protein 1A [Alkalilimnicola sp. S0819]MPQ16242.1 PBP1A family penicillin-binding protein [Alkalilimnicola sp. S0819]